MTKRLTDPAKINWERVYAAFLQMSPEEFGKGTLPHLSKILGVPRSSLGRHVREKNPRTGRDWYEERKHIYNEVQTTISKDIQESKIEQQKFIQHQSGRMFSILSKRVLEYLENPEFEANSANLKILMDSLEKVRMSYAKLIGAEGTGGKGVTMKFNINVPPKYITPEGREWLKRQVENPTQNVVNADYEILDNEDQMKMRNAKLIEEL